MPSMQLACEVIVEKVASEIDSACRGPVYSYAILSPERTT